MIVFRNTLWEIIDLLSLSRLAVSAEVADSSTRTRIASGASAFGTQSHSMENIAKKMKCNKTNENAKPSAS
jgi:hypothetical protein